MISGRTRPAPTARSLTRVAPTKRGIVTTVPAHTLDASQVTRRFDADVGVHICEGNTLKKGGQGRDRTVDLPIFSPVDFVPKDVFWLQKIDFPGFLTVKSVIRTRGILHVL